MENPLVRVTHDPGGSPIPRSAQPAIQLQADDDLDVAEFLLVGLSSDSDFQELNQ
jgi:hypothetical protein